MKNINFGNYLYELRRQNKLTQRFVAYQLGISDKAVSKWETGKSVPDLDKLKSLAMLYNIQLNELLNSMTKNTEAKISKIVLTGGPCSGRSTALNWINNYFTKRGYIVLTVPDIADELTTNGVSQQRCKTNYDYQLLLVKLQKYTEEIFESAANTMKGKILIVCDRGVMDNKAYIDDLKFKRILKELGTNEAKERDLYDAVFHLVSAAKGREEVYTPINNESIEEAKKIDDRIISSWTGHPHFRIIDNSTDFTEKLEKLLKEITTFLGDPEPYEIERKFLIRYPDIKKIEDMPNCTKVDIIQTYLKSSDGVERRIRARGIDGDYVYYLTEKKKVSNIKRIEIESKLTQDEYLKLLVEQDNKLHIIHKTRYCLSDNNQYFEIDIYPEWDKQAIMEIELNSEEQEIEIPKFIKIIREVTDEVEYKNYNMAKKMPKSE